MKTLILIFLIAGVAMSSGVLPSRNTQSVVKFNSCSLPVSKNGRCGPKFLNARCAGAPGVFCSKWGWCGTAALHKQTQQPKWNSAKCAKTPVKKIVKKPVKKVVKPVKKVVKKVKPVKKVVKIAKKPLKKVLKKPVKKAKVVKKPVKKVKVTKKVAKKPVKKVTKKAAPKPANYAIGSKKHGLPIRVSVETMRVVNPKQKLAPKPAPILTGPMKVLNKVKELTKDLKAAKKVSAPYWSLRYKQHKKANILIAQAIKNIKKFRIARRAAFIYRGFQRRYQKATNKKFKLKLRSKAHRAERLSKRLMRRALRWLRNTQATMFRLAASLRHRLHRVTKNLRAVRRVKVNSKLFKLRQKKVTVVKHLIRTVLPIVRRFRLRIYRTFRRWHVENIKRLSRDNAGRIRKYRLLIALSVLYRHRRGAAKDKSSRKGYKILINQTHRRKVALLRAIKKHWSAITRRMRTRAHNLNRRATRSFRTLMRVKKHARRSIRKRYYVHSCNVAKNIIRFSTRYVKNGKRPKTVKKARRLFDISKNIRRVLKAAAKGKGKRYNVSFRAKTFKIGAKKLAMITERNRKLFKRSINKQIIWRTNYVRRMAKLARRKTRIANRSVRKYVAHLKTTQRMVLRALIRRVKKAKRAEKLFLKYNHDPKLKGKLISVNVKGKKYQVKSKPFQVRDAKRSMVENNRRLRENKKIYQKTAKELEKARGMLENVVERRRATWEVRRRMNFRYLKNRSTLKGQVLAFRKKTMQNIVEVIKQQVLFLEKLHLRNATLQAKARRATDKKAQAKLTKKAKFLKSERNRARKMVAIAKASKKVIRRIAVIAHAIGSRMNNRNEFRKWNTTSKLTQLKLISRIKSVFRKMIAAKEAILFQKRAVAYWVDSKKNLLEIRKNGMSRVRIVSRMHRHYLRVLRRARRATNAASNKAAGAVIGIAKKMNIKVHTSSKSCNCEPRRPRVHKKKAKKAVKKAKKAKKAPKAKKAKKVVKKAKKAKKAKKVVKKAEKAKKN